MHIGERPPGILFAIIRILSGMRIFSFKTQLHVPVPFIFGNRKRPRCELSRFLSIWGKAVVSLLCSPYQEYDSGFLRKNQYKKEKTQMKTPKLAALVLTLVLSTLLPMAACAETTELIVFAAASMTETLTRIAELYKGVAPDVEIVYNFDSSGTLKTQIEEGADCDVFISAAPRQMNQLDVASGANDGGLDFVLQGTRIDLLENKVALAVPDGNPKNVTSYDQLIEGLKSGSLMLAMGNADVPVGQYTQKILSYYGVAEDELAAAGVLTYGSNVKEVTTQVAEAAVDCGILYGTDAYSAGLTVVDTATAEMCGRVIYPAAVLNITKNEEAARAFLAYLTGGEASAVFEAVGFSPLAR